jgi:hypothetical protein
VPEGAPCKTSRSTARPLTRRPTAVISNDSDLARPIEVCAGKLDHGVVVFNPHPGETARKLKKVATEYRAISDRVLKATVFPDVLQDRSGEITKPAGW